MSIVDDAERATEEVAPDPVRPARPIRPARPPMLDRYSGLFVLGLLVVAF